MDLSEQAIREVIHPTAAFSTLGDDQLASLPNSVQTNWDSSFTNPKNRIDSLEEHAHPLWRIDGCTAFGSQFYAVPLFVESLPPYRLDVFIPEPSRLPAQLRSVLDVDVTFYTRDASRIAPLGITRHILRILQHWASTFDDPRDIYRRGLFGSRIVFNNLPLNVTTAEITIVPIHPLERQLLTVPTLRRLWGERLGLPPTVDLHELVYVSQLHDSVCLVEYQGRTWIFKALTSYTKYLYHELRQLLLIPPHPNVVARPTHLVTKQCGFGGKHAVVGFTEEFHVHGSLRDLIPFLSLHNKISLAEQTKWALQLASALVHIRETTGMFYPDLRLDNIVLSEARDVVMVDFEQRGVWCEFAAPEVNAIEYVRLLAIDKMINRKVQEKYANLLTEMLPGWRHMEEGEGYLDQSEGYMEQQGSFDAPSQGFNIPWACLTPTEQEACEVYMLGRVLWCIFEASSAPQRAAVWLSYKWEPLVEFPGYTRTPKRMQELIDRCTRGRQAGLTKHIVREQNKLVLRKLENTGKSTAKEVQDAASVWWAKEIADSEKWLRDRAEGMRKEKWNENYYGRPSMREVLDTIADFRKEQGFV